VIAQVAYTHSTAFANGLIKECKRLQSCSDDLHSSSFSWKQINDVVAELESRGFSMTPRKLENKRCGSTQ
jgi:hypothetical protein